MSCWDCLALMVRGRSRNGAQPRLPWLRRSCFRSQRSKSSSENRVPGLATPLTLCYGKGSGQPGDSLGSLAPTVGPTLLGDLSRGVPIALCVCALRLPAFPHDGANCRCASLVFLPVMQRTCGISSSFFLMNPMEAEVGGLDWWVAEVWIDDYVYV